MEDRDQMVFSTYQILILQSLLEKNYTDYDQNKVYALQNLKLDQIITLYSGNNNSQMDRNLFDDGSNEVSSLL